MSDSLIGRQSPTFLWVPPHDDSLGTEVVELAEAAGLVLDPWQRLMVKLICSLDPQGAWLCFEVAMVVSRQNGKGPLDLAMPILTTDGWTTMGDIRPGQYVYGSDGKPTRVVACSETFTDQDCYRLTFTDSSTVIAGADHLWHVKDKHTGRWCDLTTEHIATRFGADARANGRREYRYRVRCDAVVDTPAVDLPIDPWLLGFWLGDGTHDRASLTVGHEDLEWVTQRVELAGAEVSGQALKDHGKAWDLRFQTGKKWSHSGFLSHLRALGVHGDKHIPEVYLTASIEQRMALLAGLMDSDGSIAISNQSPQVEFSTSNPKLAETFLRLARSLGIRVAPRRRKTVRLDNWRFLWTPTFDPFELPRKSARFKPPTSMRHELMSITDVQRVPTVPVRCIQVAAADGVYLFGRNFTPTHNSVLQALELAWLFLFGDRLIIHSAHLFETSREHFLKMQALIRDRDDFSRRVKRMREGRGAEEIELVGGQRLKFMTRKGGAGRGFTGNKVVLDEAMYLDSMMMAASLPTLATVPNAQVVYAGSAGMRHSSQLASVRKRGYARNDPALMYAEWAADKPVHDESGVLVAGDDPADEATWAKTNPGLGIRITASYVRKEMGALGGAHSLEFGTERLGVGDWPPDEEAWEVIDKEAWTAAADAGSQIVDGARIALAIGADPDRAMGTIGVCGLRADGRRHVEVIERHRGTGWIVDATVKATKKPQVKATDDGEPPALKDWEQSIVDRMTELRGKYSVCAVAVLKNNAAASLIGALTRAGLPVVSPNDTEYAQACGDFFEGIVDTQTVVHLDQPSGNAAMGGARKRELPEGGWRWSQSTAADATPNTVHTLSLWAHTNYAKIPRSKVW